MGYRKGAGKVKSTGGARMAYVHIHHVFALPRAEGRGQMAEGPRYRANYCTVHCTQHSGPVRLSSCSHAWGGKLETRPSWRSSGKDPAHALSLAGFGRMTAWRQGSFVKAAAHFERATTCLTRSLSMFRLVGVGSRPDLLVVVVCQVHKTGCHSSSGGAIAMVYYCIHHPVLF